METKTLALKVAEAVGAARLELDRSAVFSAKGKKIDAEKKAQSLAECYDIAGRGAWRVR